VPEDPASPLDPVHLDSVRLANSPAEKEAVFRFRYTIYADEQKRALPSLDPLRRWLREPEDEQDAALLLYTGTPGELTATARLRCWRPGTVPAALRRSFSMDRFPDLARRSVAEAGRLMIRPEGRGKLLPSLLWGVADAAVERGAELIFLRCSPGLVRLYARLAGARPYGGRVSESPDGISVPLVVIPGDVAYAERIGCFLAPLWRQHQGSSPQAGSEAKRYDGLFADGSLGVETEPDRMWALVEEAFVAEQVGRRGFLETLPRGLVERLSRSGLIVDVEGGSRVARKGFGEREMFLILDGLFEASVAGRRLSMLEKGDLFGEVAFFREGGERSADVRALSTGRLLTISRKFVDRLRQEDPDGAIALLTALCRVMAERLARPSLTTPLGLREARPGPAQEEGKRSEPE